MKTTETTTTYANSNPRHRIDFTLQDLESFEKMLLIEKFKSPALPTYKPSFFEKLMNKFGWYRQTTVMVIDLEKLRPSFNSFSPIEWK